MNHSYRYNSQGYPIGKPVFHNPNSQENSEGQPVYKDPFYLTPDEVLKLRTRHHRIQGETQKFIAELDWFSIIANITIREFSTKKIVYKLKGTFFKKNYRLIKPSGQTELLIKSNRMQRNKFIIYQRENHFATMCQKEKSGWYFIETKNTEKSTDQLQLGFGFNPQLCQLIVCRNGNLPIVAQLCISNNHLWTFFLEISSSEDVVLLLTCLMCLYLH